MVNVLTQAFPPYCKIFTPHCKTEEFQGPQPNMALANLIMLLAFVSNLIWNYNMRSKM